MLLTGHGIVPTLKQESWCLLFFEYQEGFGIINAFILEGLTIPIVAHFALSYFR